MKSIYTFHHVQFMVLTQKKVNEKSITKPISLYSKFCKKTEDYLKRKLKEKFVIFRLGTLYGWSPRMRYDIAINKIIRDGYFFKKNRN